MKPERVINLAYGLGVGEGNPHLVMRLDILGMDNVFEAARLTGVKRVVYASSIAVSGQQSHFGDRLATEDDPLHGTSQYAMHKMFNEFQAQQVHQELRHVDRRRAAGQRHRARQGARLGRSRADHDGGRAR